MTLRWIALVGVVGLLGLSATHGIPPCEELDRERIILICEDCSDTPFPNTCLCEMPQSVGTCTNPPAHTICERGYDKKSTNQSIFIYEIEVPCYRTFQCRAPDMTRNCSPTIECMWRETGQSGEKGNKYQEAEGACWYE